jgi:hypothetical protein
MQRKNLLSARSFVVLVFCAVFVLTAASLVDAQSGRRIPKKSTLPDPLPPAQSEPPIKLPEQKDVKPQTPVLVVKFLPYMNTSGMVGNIVMDGFMERMQASNQVKVRPGKDMNRKEASDYAKSSPDTYVVLLQLEVDSAYSRDTVGYVDPYSLYVNYIIYTPGTGKSKANGNVYQRRGAIGGLPLPGPTQRTGTAAEYSLRYAGREAADRVLSALGLTLLHRN